MEKIYEITYKNNSKILAVYKKRKDAFFDLEGWELDIENAINIQNINT